MKKSPRYPTKPKRSLPALTYLGPPSAFLGLIIMATYLILAVGGEWLAPYPPTQHHFADTLQPPSATYWLGTDQFGRDIFSRLLVGSRSIMILATGSTLLALFLGSLIGLIASYMGGWLDELLMRLTDIMLSFPVLLLALLIISTLAVCRKSKGWY